MYCAYIAGGVRVWDERAAVLSSNSPLCLHHSQASAQGQRDMQYSLPESVSTVHVSSTGLHTKN